MLRFSESVCKYIYEIVDSSAKERRISDSLIPQIQSEYEFPCRRLEKSGLCFNTF